MKLLLNIKITVILLLLINSDINAREVSFGSEELISDFASVAGLSLFGNLDYADIDGDGDKDIIVSKLSPGDQVSWLENNGGDFTDFPVHVVSTATQTFRALQVIDIDQDGDVDIVGTDQFAGELLWFENDGAGSTWTSHTIQNGTSTNSASDLSIADIDGDGDLDIVVAADDSMKLYWYENNGLAMSWTEHDTGIITAGAVATIATGDFTFDGTTDIVYGLTSGTPYIKLVGNANGDGTNWLTSTVASGVVGSINDIQVADLDLDGFVEIYFNIFNNNLTKLSFDSSSSTWLSSTVIAGGTQGKTSFVDIDNDGDLDVLLGNSINLSWHENTDGLGGAWTERVLISGLSNRIDSTQAVDLDQDGDLEIIVIKNEDGFVYAYDNLLFHSTAQMDSSSVLDDSHSNANHVITGLFNGDQYPDMITANKDSSGLEVFFYAGDANASYSSKEIVLNVSSTTDSEIIAITSGDLDGDGDLDLAFATDGTDSIYTIENMINSGPFSIGESLRNRQTTGLNWGSATLVASASGKSQEIQIADINADGKQDIIILSRAANQVIWLDNDGSWTQTVITSSSMSPFNLKIADIDNNGTLDVLTGTSASFSKWFSNDNGDGTTWTETNVGNNVAYQLDLADMDNDGDLDVVFSGSSSQNIRWVENDGSGAAPWTLHDTNISTGFTTGELHARDIDLDGDIDILLQNNNNDLLLIENIDTSIELWELTTIKSGLSSPRSFVFSDYDRDGDIDIVSKGTTSSEIILIENRGGQFSTDATGASAQNSEDSQTVAIIDLTVTHNGRDEDGDLQPSGLHLGFVEGSAASCSGEFMSSSAFNPLVESIGFYKDDGDGIFQPFSDTLIVSQSGPFALVDGQIIMTLPNLNGDSSIIPDSTNQSSQDFFVTLKYRAAASSEVCHSLFAYILQPTIPFVTDVLTAQDVNSALDLKRAYSEGAVTGEQTIVASSNNPPTTTGIADQNAITSTLFSVDISTDFNDADGDVLFYTAGGLPLSMSIDGNTGVISGTPTTIEENNSPFVVTVIASDPQGATINSMFTLTIGEDGDLIFAHGME